MAVEHLGLCWLLQTLPRLAGNTSVLTFFQLSELLAYAKNTCQFDHLYARYRVKCYHSMDGGGWGNGDVLNSFVSLGACTIK